MARPDILLFAPTAVGGLAEHLFYQAKALHRNGAQVVCLASRDFLAGRPCPFPVHRLLAVPPPTGGLRWIRRIRHVGAMLAKQFRLAWWVIKCRPRLVFLDSYTEYLSPLWIWPHLILARCLGFHYAANLHDPVRNFQLGPAWWHGLSIRLAYWPLKFVLVHDKLPEPSPVPAGIKVVQVPVGVYDFPAPNKTRAEIRAAWEAQPGHRIFLAFGYVRDGKNLDLAISALREVPMAFLVIAGMLQSGNDKPFSYYRQLADKHGVADRVRFFDGFVSDADLGGYFVATDYVLLTYSSAFNSQSGVLNVAAKAKKPVLASAAPSPLIESVKQFNLGLAVAPDSLKAVVDGMRQLVAASPTPRWEDYEAYASWDANARGIMEAAGLRHFGIVQMQRAGRVTD